MTPFRSPAFRRLWCSSLASMGAQGMERTATAWLALETGGGAFAVGLIFAARMLPSLLFGLAAATIADRADRARQLLAVAVLPGEGWRAGPPHELFNPIVTELAGPVDIAVSPDGETILVNTPVDGFTIPPVQVVVNWTGMLKPR